MRYTQTMTTTTTNNTKTRTIRICIDPQAEGLAWKSADGELSGEFGNGTERWGDDDQFTPAEALRVLLDDIDHGVWGDVEAAWDADDGGALTVTGRADARLFRWAR